MPGVVPVILVDSSSVLVSAEVVDRGFKMLTELDAEMSDNYESDLAAAPAGDSSFYCDECAAGGRRVANVLRGTRRSTGFVAKSECE